jgi:hypothetical protein
MARTSVLAAALTLAFVAPFCAHGQSIEQDRDLRQVASADALNPATAATGRKAGLLRNLARHLDAHSHKVDGKALVVSSGESTIRTYTYEDLVRSAGRRDPQLAMNMNAKPAPADMATRRIRLELPDERRDDPDLHVTVTGGSNEVGLRLTKKMP